MDLGDDDFAFCPTDFHDPMLNNELDFPDSENHGDFDLLSNLLASSRPYSFEESDLKDASFAASKQVTRPEKLKPNLPPQESQYPPTQSTDRPADLHSALSALGTSRSAMHCEAKLGLNTRDMAKHSSFKGAVAQIPRDTSSLQPIDCGPDAEVHQNDNHDGRSSLRRPGSDQTEHRGQQVFGGRRDINSQTMRSAEVLPLREIHPQNSTTGKTIAPTNGTTDHLMCIQIAEIPSIPKGNSGHIQAGRMNIDVDEVIAQIDLTRIPSGNSGESVVIRTPGYIAPIEDASQPKLRYSEGASASHYCHICGRASNTAQLAACANVQIGLCRKTLCEKCLLLHQRDMFHWAKAKDTTWTCTHCRGVCPKRARCHQYQRNNMRRRLKNAKGTTEETKETLKVERKPIAKTPTAKKANTPRGHIQTKMSRPGEELLPFNNYAAVQFSTVPMSFSGETTVFRAPENSSPNRDMSRKDSSCSQNAVSANVKHEPSGPTAHINLASGALVQFDMSATHAAMGGEETDIQKLETGIARPSTKPMVDMQNGDDGVSPAGIAQGVFSEK